MARADERGRKPLPPSLHRLLLDLVEAATGEDAAIAATRQATGSVFLDVVESQSAIRYFTEVGKRLPIHATATGKAILAQYSPAERQNVLGKIRFERYQTDFADEHRRRSKPRSLKELNPSRLVPRSATAIYVRRHWA